MRLILSVLGVLLSTTTFDVATSEFPSIRTIRQIRELGLHDPKNIGEIHNGIFKKVVEKYHQSSGSSTTPHSKEEVLQDVKASLVDLFPGNESHRQMVNDAMEDALEKITRNNLKDVAYPANMDEELADVFDQAFGHIQDLREDNLSETLAALGDLQTRVEEPSDSVSTLVRRDPFEQFRAVAALSVARSSTELWHGMKYGDDKHSRTLRELRVMGDDSSSSGRSLQAEQCSNWIINADVISFFVIAIPGTVTAWLFLIPTLLPILIPTLALASPLLILFTGPFLLLFLSTAVAFSAVGWLLGIFENECATEAPTAAPTNSTLMY